MQVLPLKRVARVRFSSVDKKSEANESPVRLCNYTDVYYRETILPILDFMEATATLSEKHNFALRMGDVLVTKDSESRDDIGIPAYVAFSHDDILCGYHLAQVRPNPELLDGKYLFWWMTSDVMREEFSARANGITRFGLKLESIASAPLRLPALAKQRAIADFLDRETARIDALIVKKNRLAHLLREAVDVWFETALHQVAEREIPLRRLLLEPPDYGAAQSAESGDPSWPRYIRITDLTPDGELRSDDIRRLRPDIAQSYVLKHGDILFARSGTVGKAFRYRTEMGPACFAGYLIRFRIDHRRVFPGIIEAWARTTHYWSQVSGASLQATIENVSAQRYKELVVPVPSLRAQAELLRELEARRIRTVALQERLRSQGNVLRERRQALITAAVTGEMDVPA